ncbi:MAG: hypothetical protein FWC06_07135 [Treponema sp.]|nr:hypothetical protein [Treponema sp.]
MDCHFIHFCKKKAMLISEGEAKGGVGGAIELKPVINDTVYPAVTLKAGTNRYTRPILVL